MAEVLMKYPSNSSDAVYEVRRGSDGVIYCSCPGWRNSKNRPKMCRHLKLYGAETGGGELNIAPPLPDLRRQKSPIPDAMLAQQIEKAPYSPWGREDWVAEAKYDGLRIFFLMQKQPRQFARSHAEHTGRYPWLDNIILPEGTLLDGEITTPGEKSSYGQKANGVVELVYVVFDVLQVGTLKLSSEPWSVRRAALETVVRSLDHPRLMLSKVLGVPSLDTAKKLIDAGGEGVMLKRRAASYQSGVRSFDWLKHKATATVDVVITDMDAKPTAGDRIAAGWKNLRYGYMVNGKLVVAGTLGITGPPEELKQYIGKVAEVKCYAQNPETGALRHPVFLRYRDDKLPEECIL